MALADACGPVGLGCLFVGMAIFGQSQDNVGWSLVGLAFGATGIVLLKLSR